MTTRQARGIYPRPVAACQLVGPWLELSQEAGYAPTAPGWPGDPDTVEDSRRDPSRAAGKSIDDVAGTTPGSSPGLRPLRPSSAAPSAASSRSGCSARTWPLPQWRSTLRRQGRAQAACSRAGRRLDRAAQASQPAATWRYRSPRSSSGTASGTRFPSRSQLSCTTAGQCPRPASPCPKPPRRT
jgi:hypothetical protein